MALAPNASYCLTAPGAAQSRDVSGAGVKPEIGKSPGWDCIQHTGTPRQRYTVITCFFPRFSRNKQKASSSKTPDCLSSKYRTQKEPCVQASPQQFYSRPADPLPLSGPMPLTAPLPSVCKWHAGTAPGSAAQLLSAVALQSPAPSAAFCPVCRKVRGVEFLTEGV